MKFSRQRLKDNEKKIRDVEAFVEGADTTELKLGRPKSNRELTKAVSISLTETDRKVLDNQAKRFNLLSYQLDLEESKQLNRSDIVRITLNRLASMNDDDFIKFLKY
ncbi:TPA: hypothetical protein ACX6NV_003081 [Photobacterium damselae]